MDWDEIKTVGDFFKSLEDECMRCAGQPPEAVIWCTDCRGTGRVLSGKGRRFLRHLYDDFEDADRRAEAWGRIAQSIS